MSSSSYGNSNRSLIASLLYILFIISANILLVDNIVNLSNFLSSGNSILSVTITSEKGDSFNLSTAGSENTACVAHAYLTAHTHYHGFTIYSF